MQILPYIDNQELYNAWQLTLPYNSPTVASPSQPSNFQIASTAIGILRCPDDNTTLPNQGNLSYAVNGGFVRFPANPISWTAVDGRQGVSTDGSAIDLVQHGDGLLRSTWPARQGVGQKLGVMFMNIARRPGAALGIGPDDAQQHRRRG